MTKKNIALSLVILIASLIAGCGGGSGVFPPVNIAGDITLLIANSLGETLSIASRSDGQWSVQTDVVTTGQGANDIVVRGDRAYIVCSLSNSIHVVNTTDLSTVREISTGDGTNPFSASIDEDGTLWVSLTLTNQLAHIDPDATEPVLDILDLPGPGEFDDANSADTNQPWPEGVCYHDGKVYVAHANLDSSYFPGGRGGISVVDAGSGSLDELIIVAGWNTADVYCPDPDGDMLYFISGGEYFGGEPGLVELYDTSLGQVVDSIELDGVPFEMAMGPSGATFVTNGETGEILRFDANTLNTWPPIPVPDSGTGWNYISGLCFTGEDEIAVLEFNGDKLYIIDGITGTVKDSFVAGDGPDAVAVIRWQ